MKLILVVPFHGLWFKGGMDTFIRPQIAKVPNVLVWPTASWSDVDRVRQNVAVARKNKSFSAIVVYGHSLGAGAASKLTDDGYVDLAFMIDPAGAAMSPFGKNTGKVFDFHDTAMAFVPKFRVYTLKGMENKRTYKQFRLGHMGITYSQDMVNTMVSEIKKLAVA
jgi:hypothetical protein